MSLVNSTSVRRSIFAARSASSTWPVLQSSANPSGAGDARRLDEVAEEIRAGVDMMLDGGELPGTPSTVVDLTRYEVGEWSIAREGAVPRDRLEALL